MGFISREENKRGEDWSSLQETGPPVGSPWMLVILLTAGNALAFFHRIIITLLAEPIKAEFALSDTAMGLLFGLFFTASFVLAVLPLARLADMGFRREVIGCCVLVWSSIFAACLIARSYAALVAARVGVGASQAGYGPAAISLISEHFEPRRLASATGTFASGVYLGGGLAMLVGGALATWLDPTAGYEVALLGRVSGWNVILFLCGLPGIAIGATLLAVIREPQHAREQTGQGGSADGPDDGSQSWLTPAHVGIIGGLVLMVLVGNATGAWIPSFFQRAHGWPTAQIGLVYGVTIVFCGVIGSIGGGWCASRLRSRGHANAHLAILLGCFVLLAPVSTSFPLVPDPWLAMALIGLMNLLASVTIGLCYALLQEITPTMRRARIAGINSLFANLAGAGLGPLVVAVLTDHFFADAARLPEAISLTAFGGSCAACMFLWGGLKPLWRPT